ncbi:repressor LexA [Candidatus Wolfebacteria bacterium]|nr:MAG: repressor LexA [Candidatus Wolfebacteria bacterium]
MDLEQQKNKIAGFFKSNKRMPTYREIAHLVGYKSTNAVYRLVKKLEDVGFLNKDSAGRLTPNNMYGDIKVLGLIEAGFPSAAEEELLDTMTIDDYLITNRDATYMLRVKGDSMKDAGINEGDMVLVERTNKYKVGDIVIADVDGEWTMKYLKQIRSKYYLEPANKNYKPIYPKESLRVVAVVRAIIRKY